MDDIELADELRRMYENAERNDAVCQINLFGIKYAKEIRSGNFTIKQIVRLSGIKMGYVAEISKGIKLSEHVELKKTIDE